MFYNYPSIDEEKVKRLAEEGVQEGNVRSLIDYIEDLFYEHRQAGRDEQAQFEADYPR